MRLSQKILDCSTDRRKWEMIVKPNELSTLESPGKIPGELSSIHQAQCELRYREKDLLRSWRVLDKTSPVGA